MTKIKFVFNINGKKVTKEPKEAIAILRKDYAEIKELCDNIAKDLITGAQLLETIEGLIVEAKKALTSAKEEKPAKVTPKKRGRPAKVVAPAPKKRGRPAKAVSPVKKIKKAIKTRKAK